MIRVLTFPALAVFVNKRDIQPNVAVIALNLFTDYVNLVADTENDFSFVTAAAKLVSLNLDQP